MIGKIDLVDALCYIDSPPVKICSRVSRIEIPSLLDTLYIKEMEAIDPLTVRYQRMVKFYSIFFSSEAPLKNVGH